MNCFLIPYLSDTALSLITLHNVDPEGWVFGTHSINHPPTGVGLWLSNGRSCMRAYYDCECKSRGYVLDGKEIKLNWIDRRILWAVFGIYKTPYRGGKIAKIIANYLDKNK